MRRVKAPTQAVRRADRRPEVEPGLRELLDHLGRLLAKEYVRLLAGEPPDKAAPRSEEGR
jgi:hypothetical protein